MDKIIKSFIQELKERISKAQYEALKVVNKEQIQLYWDIGKMIVEKQESLGWGKSVVKTLSVELQKEFPGMTGFSSDNLWRMRKFFLHYNENKKLAPLVQEISWSKNIIIMEKCNDDFEKEFYIQMTKKYGWTKNILIHRVENKDYKKFLLNQTNFEKTLPVKYKNQAKLAVKDEYTFDFLEMNDEYKERELESQLVNNIRKFLIEMGGYFTFIGNQYRVALEGNEYYIDLLLYHRALRCLVAIELKIGSFQPEFAGKMQFYLSVLNDTVKLEDENPSIGIIICKEKKRTIVEYALKDASLPIGVATYNFKEQLPDSMSKYLPSPEEIAKHLKIFNEDE